MLPVLAIVGRPNVGKSTLFNTLTKSKNALVADFPGVTRDRLYGTCQFQGREFILIDTAGLDVEARDIQAATLEQTQIAINEADAIWFVVDGRTGPMPLDLTIAQMLRSKNKKVWIVVNKVDGKEPSVLAADFYQLGFSNVLPIAAISGWGTHTLLTEFCNYLPAPESLEEEDIERDTRDKSIRIAIVGRPNVGKSTLVNRMLGEERVLVFDEPGTTRDSIYIPFERRDTKYTLIDTAGVRRRRSVSEAIEKFSVIKTLQAVESANVVIFVMDARDGIVDQDLHLLGFVMEAGKGLVFAINKWDHMQPDQRERVRSELDRRLKFLHYARHHFISALHGTGVGDLFGSVEEAYTSATKKLSTAELTTLLQRAVATHQPPLVQGRRIKLRYAHSGGNNPPRIVIHGNQTESLPDSYQRYLESFYREKLNLMGTPIRIELRTGDNPYKDRKNTLTPRQIRRRKRLIKHVKR